MKASIVVNHLLGQTQEDENEALLAWDKLSHGGYYQATINGVTLNISSGSISSEDEIFLLLLKDGKEARIVAPRTHISQTVAGRLLGFVTRGAHPKDPQSEEEKEKEGIRTGLKSLFEAVSRHYGAVVEEEPRKPVEKPDFEGIRDGLFRTVVFGQA